VWLLAGVWQLEGLRRNTGKGRSPFYLGDENAEHMLLGCWETGNWRLKFLNYKRLNMNKEVPYRKMLRRKSKDQIRNLGRYLDTVNGKLCNKTK
jgi:hypothetical protein